MQYKNHNIPDNKIDSIVNKLGISIVEACEMYLSDNGIVKDETVESLTEKANKNRITATIHKAKSGKKQRQPRKKVENPLKKEIISTIFASLQEKYPTNNTIFVENDEKYINFSIKDENFTINLVKHRQKKK